MVTIIMVKTAVSHVFNVYINTCIEDITLKSSTYACLGARQEPPTGYPICM